MVNKTQLKKEFKGVFKPNCLIIFALIALLAIGFALRIRRAGYYSLYAFDSGIHATLAREILKHGYPVLPGGNLHFRGFLYDYLIAFSTYFFGDNEFSLRLVGIIFGTLTIGVAYLLGKEIFSRKVGLSTALILTFSTWGIELSRYVRFYVQFQFFFVLSVYIFYKGFVREKKGFKTLFAVFFFLTVFSHCLGGSLLILFLLLAAHKGLKDFLRRENLKIFLITLTGYLVWFYYAIPRLFTVVPPDNTIASSGYISLPFVLFFDFAENHHIAFVFYVASMVMISLLFFKTVYKQKRFRLENIVLWIVLVLVFFQQVNLAFIFGLSYVFLAKGALSSKKSQLAKVLVIVCAGMSFWVIYGIFGWSAVGHMHLLGRFKETAMALILFGYPQLVFLGLFARAFPVMSLIVAFAVVYIFGISCLHSLNGERARYLYVWGLFILVALAMASLQDVHNETRYLYHLYPLFVLIYSYGLVEVSRLISGVVSPLRNYISKGVKIPKRNFLQALIFCILFVFTLEHSNPIEAFAITQRKHGDRIKSLLSPSSTIIVYPDYKSAGEYVRGRLKGEDVVVFLGFAKPVIQYYAGRLDYSLSLTEDVFIEKNTPAAHKLTGCGTIGLNRFRQMIDDGQTVWLIVSSISGHFRKELYSHQDVEKFFLRYQGNLQFTSRDGNFKVYRFN